MASWSDAVYTVDHVVTRRCSENGSNNCFGKHRVLGQYYVAAMLFIVNAIYTWRFLNMLHSFNFAKNNPHFFSPAVESWTAKDSQTFYYADFGGQIFIQVPAALLIYLISSHKFLTAAVAISSLLHVLTPVAINLQSRSLAVMLYAHLIVAAPLRIAVLSMWKDLAPPSERTKFVFISFASLFMSFPFSLLISSFSGFYAKEESFYISGACGLCWSLVWYLTVTDTPLSNTQCANFEQFYLQNNTLTTVKERPKLSEVPWKSILMSNSVFALCLIYFKIGGTFVLLMTMISVFAVKLDISDYLGFANFHYMFAIFYTVVLFISAIATDFLIRKYPRMINTKKAFLCEVLFLHGFLVLGTLFHYIIPQVIFFCLSYCIFSISLAGFITNALDLSSRYVTIIGGFIETFYLLGVFLSVYYLQSIFKYLGEQKDEYPYGKLLVYEVVITLFVSVVFWFWGSVEEQPWSLNSTSCSRSADAEAHTIVEEHELIEVPCSTFKSRNITSKI